MSEWKNLKKHGPPDAHQCCLVTMVGKYGWERAIYFPSSNTFCLDCPCSPHALLPLHVDYYFVVPELVEIEDD